MISKGKLIQTLKDSANLEDEAAILITTTLKKRIEESSFSERKRQRIIEIADTIKTEAEGHKKMISEMIKKVEEGGQDEF